MVVVVGRVVVGRVVVGRVVVGRVVVGRVVVGRGAVGRGGRVVGTGAGAQAHPAMRVDTVSITPNAFKRLLPDPRKRRSRGGASMGVTPATLTLDPPVDRSGVVQVVVSQGFRSGVPVGVPS